MMAITAHSTAQRDGQETIEEMTVLASRLDKPVSAIPNTVTIIDREQIARGIAINDSLSSVLEQSVPGFGPSLNKMAGRGESLRGRNPLYLIDGVPQHNALRDGQRDGHTIDMDFVERIEVIHGSNSIQGVGATGGVINLVTKSPKEGNSFSQDIKFSLSAPDDFDSDGLHKKLTYTMAGRVDNLAMTLGVAYNDRGLFFDAEGDPVGLYPTQGDIMDSRSQDVFFKTVYELEDQRLQLMINDFELKRNGDFVSVAGDRTTGQLTSTVEGDPRPVVGDPARNHATTVSLDYVHEDFHDWRLITQLYFQDFGGRYEGGYFGGYFRLTSDGPAILDQSEIQSQKLGFKFLASRKDLAVEGLDFTVGLDVSKDKTAQVLVQTNDRPWVPEASLQDVAPFVQLDFTPLDSLQLTAGVRLERAELSVDNYTTIAAANSTFVEGGEPDFQETMINVGAVYKLSDTVSVFTSFNEGFTMPDVGRVLRGINVPGQSVESFLDLTPVITENIEVGMKFDDGSWLLDASVYQSDSDLGSRLNLDDAGIFHVEREKTRIWGLNLSSRWQVTDALRIGANYAYIEGEYDSDGDGSVDTDLDGANIAPNRLNAYVEMALPRGISARLSGSHLFSRSFSGPGISDARRDLIDFDDAYTLFHLNAEWNTNTGDWSLAVQNLLDKQYVTYFSQTETGQRNNSFFAGLGRTFSVAYTKDF